MVDYQLLVTRLQGLSYLLGGFLTFVSILSLLRFMGEREECPVAKDEEEDSWVVKEALTIVDIIQETEDIKTFRLQRAEQGLFPPFLEGQFLSFFIGDPEKKILRSYSISSSPLNRKILNISVKLLRDGIGSSWFHNREIGDTVIAVPPTGLFSPGLLPSKDVDLILVAGGIGITPILSIVRAAVDTMRPATVLLFYAARSRSDLAFHDLLSHYVRVFKNFKYYPIIEVDDEKWTGLKGRLTMDIMKQKIDDLKSNHYYFCGPPPMTESLSSALKEDGVSEDNIHIERFASPEVLDDTKFEEKEVTVKFNGKNLNYKSQKTLLEFLEEKEINLSFGCRNGVCGLCKAHLLAGEVQQLTRDGLSKQEQKDGYILSCVSRPQTDIELEAED
ncbi:2Fe-2S iron-sulfur cluster-binding protein [Candidatus Riflebacteria bacterium]